MIHLDEKFEDLQIEMVEIAIGCSEACKKCGAYPNFLKENLVIRQLTREQVMENLEEYSDHLAPYMTTYVNVEPRRIDVFADYAELVYEKTNGGSQVLDISHGVRRGSKKMMKRLESRIIPLFNDGVIPLSVLSFDRDRSQGQIDYDLNVDSYAETLEIMKQVMRDVRVTLSMQAENADEMVLIEEMRQDLMQRLAWSDEDASFLNIDRRVGYTAAGRSAGLIESVDCPVIPDAGFLEMVKDHWPRTHKWRGLIDMYGDLYVQPNVPDRTYGDSLKMRDEEVCIKL